MTHIIETSAKKLWTTALDHIMQQGREYTDYDNRTCKEVDNLMLTLRDVGQSRYEDPIHVMLSQEQWLYPSKEELESIIFKQEDVPAYDYTYGGRIFNFAQQINQIDDYLLKKLRDNPNTRQGVVVLFNPCEDCSTKTINKPSLMYLYVTISNNQLNLTAHYRSSDLLFGWPANLFQLYKLQSYIAKQIDKSLGDITFVCNSAHIFLEQKDFVLTLFT